MATTFNPAVKNANITLSGGNLVATNASFVGWATVQATDFKSSGKSYCEITMTDFGGGESNFVGISNSSQSVADGAFPGDSANGYGLGESGGYKYHSGVPEPYSPASVSFVQGDVLSILYDGDLGTIAFWCNGANWGTAYTGLTGSFAPTVCLYAATRPSIFTANFGDSAFVYDAERIAAGYEAWTQVGSSPGSFSWGTAQSEFVAMFGSTPGTTSWAGTVPIPIADVFLFSVPSD